MATKKNIKNAKPAAAAAAPAPAKGKRTIVNKADKVTLKDLFEEAKGGNKRSALAAICRGALSVAVEAGAGGIDVPYKSNRADGKKVDHATRVRNELSPEWSATKAKRSGVVWEGDDAAISQLLSLAKKAAPDVTAKDYSANIKALLNKVIELRPPSKRKAGTGGKPKTPSLKAQMGELAGYL